MIPQKAIDLILESEGIDQPSKWPGGASGITIGYGYDLGFEKDFARDWDGYMPSGHIERLKAALGKTGQSAAAIAFRFRDIKVDRTASLNVFMSKTLPKYEGQTRAAFPGCEKLPPLAFGALVSLVFNRGAGMGGDRRREMRAIRDAIDTHAAGRIELKYCLLEIASQFRLMKRLWRGKGLNGLLVRRENEAKMVEAAAA